MTNFKIMARRNAIRKMMIKGRATNHIVSSMKETHGVSKVTVEADITAIYKDIKKELTLKSSNLTDLHVARYEDMYQILMDEESPKYSPVDAAKILEKKERLLGMINKSGESVTLFQQNNIVNHNNVDVSVYTTEELLKLKEILGNG